jgi:hypothetical protein
MRFTNSTPLHHAKENGPLTHNSVGPGYGQYNTIFLFRPHPRRQRRNQESKVAQGLSPIHAPATDQRAISNQDLIRVRLRDPPASLTRHVFESLTENNSLCSHFLHEIAT